MSSDDARNQGGGAGELREFGIRRSAAEKPDIVGDGLVVVATTRDLQLSKLATPARPRRSSTSVRRGCRTFRRSPASCRPRPGSRWSAAPDGPEAAFDLELPALTGRGAIQIALDDVQVRYGELDLHGRMQIDLALATAALPAGRFDLAGTSIALTEFRSPQFAGDEPPVAAPEAPEGGGWWARIELPEGEIDLPPEPAASGHLRVRLRDSVPFIGLFETRRNLPRWVERLLTVRDLQAESGFAYEDEAFTLDEFRMPFKKATIRARVRFGAEHKTGILLVGWRKLGLGLRFDDERRRLKLLRARDWYAAQGLDLSTSEVQVDPAETFSEEALGTVSFAGLSPEPLSLADLELAELEEGDEGDGASRPRRRSRSSPAASRAATSMATAGKRRPSFSRGAGPASRPSFFWRRSTIGTDGPRTWPRCLSGRARRSAGCASKTVRSSSIAAGAANESATYPPWREAPQDAPVETCRSRSPRRTHGVFR